MIFRMNLVLKVLILNLILSFKNWKPKPPKLGYFVPKRIINLNDVLPVPGFEGDDFKSDICFRKFFAQIPRFGLFGQKNITFL